jgi:hypothetical protein
VNSGTHVNRWSYKSGIKTSLEPQLIHFLVLPNSGFDQKEKEKGNI